MMLTPLKTNLHEREATSTIMAFFLVLGLALGSIFGSLLKLLVF